MFLTVVLLVVGIALVLLGADKLTDGATGLARRFNVTEMVIGLTVVAVVAGVCDQFYVGVERKQ